MNNERLMKWYVWSFFIKSVKYYLESQAKQQRAKTFYKMSSETQFDSLYFRCIHLAMYFSVGWYYSVTRWLCYYSIFGHL